MGLPSLPVYPEALAGRRGGSAIMWVTGNRQAYWLSNSLFISSLCAASPCVFLCFSSSLFLPPPPHPVSPSSLTRKRFSLSSQRKKEVRGRCKSLPVSVALSHTFTRAHSQPRTSERQLAVICHCNTLVDCVSKSSRTLFSFFFLQTCRHVTFLRRQVGLREGERE